MRPRLARVTMILAGGVLALAVLATAQPKDPLRGHLEARCRQEQVQPGSGSEGLRRSTYEAAGPGYQGLA